MDQWEENDRTRPRPCIAIVGPPNSGKTTLLRLLDLALRKHPTKPLAYVVKGKCNGTATNDKSAAGPDLAANGLKSRSSTSGANTPPKTFKCSPNAAISWPFAAPRSV